MDKIFYIILIKYIKTLLLTQMRFFTYYSPSRIQTTFNKNEHFYFYQIWM